MGSWGAWRLPERDGTADVPPWSGAGGAERLQVRRVGAMRGGDTPFMSMGAEGMPSAGRTEISPRVMNRRYGSLARQGSTPKTRNEPGGMQREARSGPPLPRWCCVYSTHLAFNAKRHVVQSSRSFLRSTRSVMSYSLVAHSCCVD